jgi:seryl-tRNA synthetase
VLDLDELLRADAEQRRLQYDLEGLQRQRNENARNVRSASPSERQELIQRGRDIATRTVTSTCATHSTTPPQRLRVYSYRCSSSVAIVP